MSCVTFEANLLQILLLRKSNGGEGEIRTHGPLRGNGFQDRRIRPLCHLSNVATTLIQATYKIYFLFLKSKIQDCNKNVIKISMI
jgi:hypothetical protein